MGPLQSTCNFADENLYTYITEAEKFTEVRFSSRYAQLISLGFNSVEHILDTVITQLAVFSHLAIWKVIYSIFKGDVLNGYVREAAGSNEATKTYCLYPQLSSALYSVIATFRSLFRFTLFCFFSHSR